MDVLVAPLEVSFIQRALLGSVLAAVLCACVGTWVVQRGLTFFGEAMSHGMLPGVAVASILGANLMIGAAASALVMAGGVVWVARRTRLSQDVGIGLLFVGMLAMGVMIVSHADSFAVDLTAFLFGDVLAVRTSDLIVLLCAVLLTVLATTALHRPFMALAVDERKARTLGLHPGAAHAAMLILTALAAVAAFQVVGTLLVMSLLIAPPATASLLFPSVPTIMIGASAIGALSAFLGLLVSWHAQTAAGATIAATSVLLFFLTLLITRAARGPAR